MKNFVLLVIGLTLALAAVVFVANPLFFIASSVVILGEGRRILGPSEKTRARVELLEYAAETGSVSSVRTLASDISVRWAANFPQRTAHLAAKNDQVPVLELLVSEYGLNVNSTGGLYENWTPLDVALFHASANAAEFLIANGAKVRVSNQLGLESLLGSICDERTRELPRRQAALAVAGILLAHGEPVRVARPDGPDPLLLAIRSNFPEMVHLLATNGADTKAPRGRSGTPEEFARQQGCEKCLQIIVARNAP